MPTLEVFLAAEKRSTMATSQTAGTVQQQPPEVKLATASKHN